MEAPSKALSFAGCCGIARVPPRTAAIFNPVPGGCAVPPVRCQVLARVGRIP